jgi:hypothetical protein
MEYFVYSDTDNTDNSDIDDSVTDDSVASIRNCPESSHSEGSYPDLSNPDPNKEHGYMLGGRSKVYGLWTDELYSDSDDSDNCKDCRKRGMRGGGKILDKLLKEREKVLLDIEKDKR